MKRNHQELFDYYDERAREYEEFYHGNFASPIDSPELYRDDTRELSRLLPSFISGHCLDIACGTGFWLPFYQNNCTHVTLIDQSAPALEEARKKIDDLGIQKKVTIVQNDIFAYDYPEDEYDCINIGFLISHFTDEELSRFFDILKRCLKQRGQFILIDSTWNDYVAGLGRQQQGLTPRELFDGRKFDIYKRFFEARDLDSIGENHGCTINIEYWGNVFFLTVGTFG